MHAARNSDRQWWITIAAIFAPLILLLVVAVMTWHSERRYAVVTSQVVHDYAAIAAWQYARRASSALHEEAMNALHGISPGHKRTGLHSPLDSPAQILTGRSESSATLLRHARFAFTFDFRTGQLVSTGGPVDEATRAMLERRLRRIALSAQRDAEPHRVIFDSSGGTEYAIALWTIASPDAPIGSYGIVADAGVLARRLSEIVGEASLLPATARGARVTADDLAIRLTREDGGVVFATSRAPGVTAATDSSGLELSGLRATIDIPPHMVDALLVGGAPASRLPALALMIVVAAALAAIGVRHERRARELGRLRTRFVANVSHELRTPLAQISMFAETLSLGRERNDAERRQFASIIFAEARRLTAIVESVLRFSRGDAARDRLRAERVAVSDEIESAVAAFAPIAEAAGASVEVDASPDVYAQLDRAAFRQIMLNLLDNAVKHSGRNATVAISMASRPDEVRIMVDDSGPGVPVGWREQVFEPFVRMESGHVAGAGIGLAVVRDLTIAHAGRVWIEESPLGGARFIVTLPAAASASESAADLARANV